jgi:hypothetical protein
MFSRGFNSIHFDLQVSLLAIYLINSAIEEKKRKKERKKENARLALWCGVENFKRNFRETNQK